MTTVTRPAGVTSAVDYKQDFKELYSPPVGRVVFVDVPEMQFLMIDGAGDPNTAPEYREAVQALYTIAYGLKFAIKKESAIVYPVPPLEGLWWAADMNAFLEANKAAYQWTMMIRQPTPVTAALVDRVRAALPPDKNLPAMARMRFARFAEGQSAQVLHIGPYSTEAPTIARLHAFIHEQGYVLRGLHHEIYLGDPRRSAPEHLKTVIRQPVAPA